MKRLHVRAALLLALAMGAMSHTASSASPSSLRKLMEQQYRKMDQAAARLDLKGYTSYAASDIVGADEGETFTGTEQFAKHLSEDFDATKKMYVFTSKISHLSGVDDLVKVDLTTHMVCDSADPEGKYGPKGAVHRFDIEMMFHHEWRRMSNRWLITRFDTVGFSGTMDGQAIPQPEPK